MTAEATEIGFVAIGRNEGERLRRCLAALPRESHPVVYVDSASKDNSVAAAKALGVVVVALDESTPLTAARARNEGFARLIADAPNTDYVMFIDGDCELAPGFPIAARAVFESDSSCGVIAGRVRERNRDATIYNRLCDLEWAGPQGEICATGGIFMIRRLLFEKVGGFNPMIVAAEDDELCIRLREAGAKIWRVADDMCFHDAEMTRFGQWWRRAVRAGHAYAQVGALHKSYFLPERRRAIGWGLLLPALSIGAAPFTGGWSVLALALYPVSYVRTRMRLLNEGSSAADAGLFAAFLTLSKFPNLIGMAGYWRKRLAGRPVGIVEYK
ncbi:MAG TPA: glycosyltransferase [Parvularculaceae bacterium]|nr:glycosyltransferase [Parvularculaceae bacterium]